MIEKLKFVRISGPKNDIDRVVDVYLSKYEIHLENALTELKTVKDLIPFNETNPYREITRKSNELYSMVTANTPSGSSTLELAQAVALIEEISGEINRLKAEQASVEAHKNQLYASLDKISLFHGLNFDVPTILNFKYIKFRFGRISREHYEGFKAYIDNIIDTLFIKCEEDDEYITGVYFVPLVKENKIDAIYSSMHFERYFLPADYTGTPAEASQALEKSIREDEEKLREINGSIASILKERGAEIIAAHRKLETYNTNFDVRKLAACTDEKRNIFYILCGWMTVEDTRRFQADVERDENLYCIIEDDHNNIISLPPTKLKNSGIFKPFEMFIRMYGLPDYHEFDPTILVAITYSLLFGFMFGDIGQGLVLFIGGLLLYKARKINLAAIIACAGFFSTIFGFLFGSFFGFEGVIEPLWLHPTTHMTNLPSIGSLNTVFVVAVGVGMAVILFTMIVHIRNAIRVRDIEGIFFDANGLAGVVFYGGVVGMISLFIAGKSLPGAALLLLILVLPLLAIAGKEPLTALAEGKPDVMPKEKGMFFVQGFFELFELLLSYFSNTLSFVRVGAFAVSHAAMMSVVMMLAGAENGGAPNWLVVILGNLFVMGMEGLIVGIQVLRLEYYELFSRFYKGGGREFQPYSETQLLNKAK